MRRYETIFIIRPNVVEDDIEAVITKISSIIEGDGGTIIKVDKWGLKKLAYLIQKESQGYYVYVDYASISASVSEIERVSRIDDRVLKYLTVKLADSCDPEAIKKELADAETSRATAEDEAKKEKASPSKSAETPAEDEVKEEKASPAESVETPAEDEAKEEKASPSESAETPAEDEVQEEKESPSEK